MFTIDNCHADMNHVNLGFSEYDPEHKSFNIIKLDNGQFAAQPNNRILWKDASLIPKETLPCDFKVCSQNYKVENTDKWTVGHTDDWYYKSEDESKDNSST